MVTKIDLLNPLTLKNLQLQVADIVSFDEIKEANKLFVDLNFSLDEFKKSSNFNNSASYKSYQGIIIELKFVLFAGLSDREGIELVENHLLKGLSIGNFSFIEKLRQKMSFIESENDQIIFIKELLKKIQLNQEILGKRDLLLSGKTTNASISNWLKDYLSFLSGSILRTSFEEIEYVNKNQNANKLDKLDRTKLLEILKIFDSLKARIHDYDSTPVINDEKEAFKDFDLFDLFPNLEVVENPKTSIVQNETPLTLENESTEPQKNKSNIIPKFPDFKKIEEIQRPPPSILPNTIDVLKSQINTIPKTPLPNPAVKPEVKKLDDQTRGKIDAKLEELERRIKN